MFFNLDRPGEYEQYTLGGQVVYVGEIDNQTGEYIKKSILNMNGGHEVRDETLELLKMILPKRNDELLYDLRNNDEIAKLLFQICKKIG